MSKDRRVQRTRRHLKSTLHTLLESHDYATLTVQHICEAADIGRATFYLHFTDKDALLWAILQDTFADLQANPGTLDPQTLLADGKPLSYHMFAYAAGHQALMRAVFGVAAGGGGLALRLVDVIAAGSYAAHAPLRAQASHMAVEPLVVAHHLAGALVGTMRWWVQHNFQPDAATMAYQFSLLAAPGVLGALGMDG